MWNVIHRGLRARKVRLLLTALSVLLGVGFVTGVFVLTDTLRSSFDRVFAVTALDVDLVVRSGGARVDDAARSERMSDDVVETVRRVSGVVAADGVVQGIAKLQRADGEIVQGALAPTIGMSWPTVEGVGPLRLVDDGISRAPSDPGEVAVDAVTAAGYGFTVGDEIGVQVGSRPVEPYTIVGIFALGDLTSLAGATFAAFDLPVAQDGFDAMGLIDLVNVRHEPDIATDEIQQRILSAVGPGFAVLDAQVAAEDLGEPLQEGLGLLERLLLAFAAVGLFAGAFIIFNTFSVLVSQRTRELGLLRSLGATHRQVVGGVLVEALAIGVIAGVLGLLLGIGLVSVLLAVFPDLGFEIPDGPIIVRLRTVLVGVGMGMAVTLASALVPALRAARVPPVVALAHAARAPSTRSLARRSVTGFLLVLTGGGLVAFGMAGGPGGIEIQVGAVALGCFTIFLGVVLVSPVVVGPVAALYVSGRAVETLARRNATRNPRRTMATASALTLALTLMCLVAILLSSVRLSLQSGIEEGVDADIVLSAPDFAPISRQGIEEGAALPSVENHAEISFGYGHIAGRSELIAGINPEAFDGVVALALRSGSTRDVRDGILVSSVDADRLGLVVGGLVDIVFSPFSGTTLPVVGIYENRSFTGSVLVDFIVSEEVFVRGFGESVPATLAFLRTGPGSGDATRAEIAELLKTRFPDIRVQSVGQFQDEQDRSIDFIVNALLALLIFSLLIAVLGIVNTLFLSVHERTRELGLLRTLGMSARQVRSMIRGEAIVIAALGCVFGVLLGVAWGWAFTKALSDEGVTRLSVPLGQLAVFVVIAASAGVVASLAPAWRASRLDVLEAVAEE